MPRIVSSLVGALSLIFGLSLSIPANPANANTHQEAGLHLAVAGELRAISPMSSCKPLSGSKKYEASNKTGETVLLTGKQTTSTTCTKDGSLPGKPKSHGSTSLGKSSARSSGSRSSTSNSSTGSRDSVSPRNNSRPVDILTGNVFQPASPPPPYRLVNNGGPRVEVDCHLVGQVITWAQFQYRGCPPPKPANSGKNAQTLNQSSTPPASITIRDIAEFTPTPGTAHMEPPGWMIVGLDTNFYAKTVTHTKTGNLLGENAQVKFTPKKFHWDYGDGTQKTVNHTGDTWERLGLKEFDPTPASHIYRHPGHYTITLDITFNAEWRWADTNTWLPVEGTITLPANKLEALAAAGAKTILVQETCLQNPNGVGCHTN